MKFACDACGARYHIDDRKVRGKTLRIRCTKCDHPLTVRDATGARPTVTAPSPEPVAAPVETEWFYAVDGNTFGPYTEAALRRLLVSGDVAATAHVWTAELGDWQVATLVEPFASTLAPPSPAAPTAADDAAPEPEPVSSGPPPFRPPGTESSSGSEQAGNAALVEPRPGDETTEAEPPAALLRALARKIRAHAPAAEGSPTEAAAPHSESPTAEADSDDTVAVDGLAEALDTVAAEREEEEPTPADGPPPNDGAREAVASGLRARLAARRPAVAASIGTDPSPSASIFDDTTVEVSHDDATAETGRGVEPAVAEPSAVSAADRAGESEAEPDDTVAVGRSDDGGADLDETVAVARAGASGDDGDETVAVPGSADGSTDDDETVAVGRPDESGRIATESGSPAAIAANDDEPGLERSAGGAPPVQENAAGGRPSEPTPPPIPVGAIPSAAADDAAPAADVSDAKDEAPTEELADESTDDVSTEDEARIRELEAEFAFPSGASGPRHTFEPAEPPAPVSDRESRRGTVVFWVVAVAAILVVTMGVSLRHPETASVEESVDEGSAAGESAGQDTAPGPEPEMTTAAQAQAERNREVAVLRSKRVVSGAMDAAKVAAATADPDESEDAERRSRHRPRSRDEGTEAAAAPTGTGPAIDPAIGLALPSPVAARREEPTATDAPAESHFAEGLRTFVHNSIVRCSQRQATEEGSLQQARVELELLVQPSGRVSEVSPGSELANTAFGRCLASHRERWLFPSFSGEAVTLRKTFVLQ